MNQIESSIRIIHVYSYFKQKIMGSWTEGEMTFEAAFKNETVPRFMRVGMSEAIPWFYRKKDASGMYK